MWRLFNILANPTHAKRMRPSIVFRLFGVLCFMSRLCGTMLLRSCLWIFGNRLLPAIARATVVVTSYDVLRNDVDLLSPHTYNYCVLDEGHIIRNSKAKNTQVRKRKSWSLGNLRPNGWQIGGKEDSRQSPLDFIRHAHSEQRSRTMVVVRFPHARLFGHGTAI